MYAIVWDNGHASGTFEERYDDYDDAQEAAEEWRLEMAFIDDDPIEALSCYSYDIMEDDEE